MLVRPYEMPWRPAYELWAAAAWAGGLFYFVYLGGKGLLTASIALALAFLALTIILCLAIVRSAFGQVLVAIRGERNGVIEHGLQNPEIGQIAAAGEQGRFIAEQGRRLLFQLMVYGEMTGDQCRAGTADPIACRRLLKSRDHIGMLGETQIVIAGKIDQAFAVAFGQHAAALRLHVPAAP